jgi:hypothetical protein
MPGALTREYILSLPPGEEMDALVATQCLGFVEPQSAFGRLKGDGRINILPEGMFKDCFRPSTSLDCLQSVLDWLVANEPHVRLEVDHDSRNLRYDWAVRAGLTTEWAFGDSLPHAVCKCALLLALARKEER